MPSPFFQIEKADGPPPLIKIRFVKDAPATELLADLQAFFETSLEEHRNYYVIDMRELPYPTTNLIALLIATTVRARRLHGDVILENVSHTARDNFITFSALSFLAVDQELPVANPAPPRSTPEAEDLDLDDLVKIAEPPVVRQLDDALHAADLDDFSVPSPDPQEAHVKTHLCRVESKAANLYQLCDFVVEHAKQAGVKEKEIGKIRIAIYEACLNVIEHAYHSNPDNWIDLTVHYTLDRFVMVIGDRGLSFEMKLHKDFDVQEAVEARRTGGFGMHIIKRAVDAVEYYPDIVKGNRLVLTKNLR